jgi:hypothetical protein
MEDIMETIRIIKCNCNTGLACKQQDEMYGKGMRVCNVDAKDKAACTCCGKKEV